MPLVLLLLKSNEFYIVSRLYCFVLSNVSDDSVIVFLFSFLFFRIFLLRCAFLSKELSFLLRYCYYLFIFNCVNKFLCAFFLYHRQHIQYMFLFFKRYSLFSAHICSWNMSSFINLSSGYKDIRFLFLANVYFYILTFLIRLVGLYFLVLYFCFHTLPVWYPGAPSCFAILTETNGWNLV